MREISLSESSYSMHVHEITGLSCIQIAAQMGPSTLARVLIIDNKTNINLSNLTLKGHSKQ